MDQPPVFAREVVVALPARIPRARAVRGTLISLSQRALRDAQLYDAYWSHIPEQKREPLLAPVPNAWLDIDLALAHYNACDRLGLADDAIDRLGRSVGGGINSIFIQSMVTLAGKSVTPWFGWQHSQRVWSRAWDGSALGVERVGPKDALVTVAGFPCAEFPYVRRALIGFFVRNTQLFCNRAHVKSLPTQPGSESLRYSVAWA